MIKIFAIFMFVFTFCAFAQAGPARAAAPIDDVISNEQPQIGQTSLLRSLQNIISEIKPIPKDTEQPAPKKESPATSSPFLLPKGIPSSKVPDYVERPEDSLFIVELVSKDDKAILDDAFMVYLDGDEVLVPFSKLMQAFQFPIAIDPASSRAEGWYLNEQNTFTLESPFETVSIKGEKKKINGTVESHADDIYVAADVLSEWFPVSLSFNFNELKLYVKTSEDLPFKVLAERMSRWKHLETRKNKNADNTPDFKKTLFLPYKLLTFPSVQMTDSITASKSNDAGTQSINTNKSFQATGDVAWHTMNFFGNISKNFGDVEEKDTKLNNVTLNLAKKDIRANLLGPAKATSYEFGDVSSYSFPLATGNQRGRGAIVTNAPPNYVRSPNDFVIEGFATQGWDVEVYQDERLLDFQKVATDGRYRFEDIELREGYNLFRIILYGPNGEKQERFEKFFLGQDMVEPGKFIYQASAMESSTPLFNIEDQDETDPTASLLGEYGLTKNMSVYGGLFKGPISQGSLTSVGTGARFSLGPTYTELNTLQDMSGARSIGANITGNITDTIAASAGHTQHFGYKTGEREIVRETYARLSKLYSLLGLVQGSYSFGVKQALSDEGEKTNIFTNRISGTIGGMNLTNELEYAKQEAAEKNIDGSLTMTQRLPIGALRGRLNYEIEPLNELTSGEVQFQTDIDDKTSLSFAVNSQFSQEKLTKLRSSIDHIFEKFRLGASGEIDTNKDVTLGINLTYNFIPRTQSGRYSMTSSATSLNSGQLQIIPYIDSNQNNAYDEGEKAVEGVVFKNTLRGTNAKTNETGTALLDGLSFDSINKVSIDTKSLPEIYMLPGIESLDVYGKAGISGPVYYPITMLGEISGTLESAASSDSKKALPNIELMLVSNEGKVIAQTYSEYDGFFTFQSVPMGEYHIYMPPSPELAAIYEGPKESEVFALSTDKTEITGLAITLARNSMSIDEAVQ